MLPTIKKKSKTDFNQYEVFFNRTKVLFLGI